MLRKILLLLIGFLFLTGCGGAKTAAETDASRDRDPADAETASVPEAAAAEAETAYGVFLGAGPEALPRMLAYDTVVLDAEYFTEAQIAELHAAGHTVLSYLNVGSVEDFRPYYRTYEPYTIGDYENWEEERWVDVSSKAWRDFILNELAPGLLEKGVDGFFVDNADVYDYRQTEAIYEGLTDILQGLRRLETYVCINGGDVYVTEYLDRQGDLRGIADAVNQETVFSRIDWDKGSFSGSTEEDRAYFQKYVETVAENGGDVFLLEYTEDPALIAQIRAYCGAHHFRYYISDDTELQ